MVFSIEVKVHNQVLMHWHCNFEFYFVHTLRSSHLTLHYWYINLAISILIEWVISEYEILSWKKNTQSSLWNIKHYWCTSFKSYAYEVVAWKPLTKNSAFCLIASSNYRGWSSLFSSPWVVSWWGQTSFCDWQRTCNLPSASELPHFFGSVMYYQLT